MSYGTLVLSRWWGGLVALIGLIVLSIFLVRDEEKYIVEGSFMGYGRSFSKWIPWIDERPMIDYVKMCMQ